MSFELPDLDTRTSGGLEAELLRRIPMFTPVWTDFNDSDPGITLLQLLCWIGESLLYQNNAIPLPTQQNFLRWVLGLAAVSNQTEYSAAAEQQNDFAFLALRAVLADMDAGVPLDADALQSAVLTFQSTPYLALSIGDVEALARQANLVIDKQQAEAKTVGTAPAAAPLRVRRADAVVSDQATIVHILSDAAISYAAPAIGTPANPDAGGWLRRILVAQGPTTVTSGTGTAETTLLDTVRTYLAPRVLLGSRVVVASAQVTPINVTARLSCPPNLDLSVVLNAVNGALLTYFQPDQRWTYGTPPEDGQVFNLIAAIPGVDAVESFALTYVPSVLLPGMAELSADTRLAALPAQPPAMIYVGLPRVRCLDLWARSADS